MKLMRASGSGWWPAWPRASLRTYLVAMILLGTLPSVLLMSWQVFSDIKAKQRELDAQLQRSAESLARGIERELTANVEALSILAGDDALQRDDVPAFAASFADQPPVRAGWGGVFLLRPDGQPLFDTVHPGAPPPPGLKLLAQAVHASGRPVVSDLLDGPAGDRFGTAVLVPVRIDGQVRYALGAWLDAGMWQRLLEGAGQPSEGFLSLYDRQRRLIARAAENGPAAAVGQSLPPEAVRWVDGSAAGVKRGERLGGGSTFVAWQNAGYGWGVGVGVEAEPLEARARRAVLATLATATACLMLGVALALWVARRVTQPLRQLATAGPRQPLGAIVVNEITVLRDALVAAEAQEAVARTRLQSKADEFETLFHSIPVGLMVAHDPQCRSVLHNAAMDTLAGPANAAGQVRVLHRGRLLEPAEQPLHRAAASGQAVRGLELELQFPDRPPRHVIAHAAPLLDAAGRPRGAIGALVDISERKLAEARLTHADRRLRESQHLVDLAQEAGHVGFFHYHVGTDTASWTSGHAKLFGLRSKRVEGPLAEWIERIHPEDRPGVRQALARLLRQRAERLTLEFRVAPRDGHTRWLSSRVLMSYAEDGRPLQAIGITVDMTEQKAAEQERAALVEREQAARREAEAASRAKDEFLAMLGHELRNPLSAISSAVEVLNRGGANEALAANARNIIGRQTRHLARLMEDLLDVARVISGKVVLSRQPLELSALVQRLVGTLQLTGQTQQHDVQLALHEVWVDADATRIEQVVNNLLTNALKYTPEGRRIELRLSREDGQVLLEVRDQGLGIPPALLPRVFDLFVQGERTLDRRAGGLGIGLTLVRRLVEMHGGTVGVRSSSEGSTFSVRLPAIEPPALTLQPAREQRLAARQRHVLLVEDNADAMSALRSLLELDGHTVSTATDGVAGLAELLRLRPEVAVIDIGLPGLTGYEVAKRSRAGGHAGRLIALSGYGQGRDVQQALRAGFDAHLVKPVDPEALRKLLAEP
ncbi:hybrid sensor histidine kinase/response regulator [Azohydromonas caseinilytica]|uniref:histidine kinase n=1 Tax=Azohydromonas caseinilytica TaxID=2728836 RepID=A0A848F4L6_9BURK|nr:ATP-binding protein [Azohydromonas caseinilytica]NML13546.1 response regulator [Azohydromonas caseinilytica]